jgi:hypothetical protein
MQPRSVLCRRTDDMAHVDTDSALLVERLSRNSRGIVRGLGKCHVAIPVGGRRYRNFVILQTFAPAVRDTWSAAIQYSWIVPPCGLGGTRN